MARPERVSSESHNITIDLCPATNRKLKDLDSLWKSGRAYQPKIVGKETRAELFCQSNIEGVGSRDIVTKTPGRVDEPGDCNLAEVPSRQSLERGLSARLVDSLGHDVHVSDCCKDLRKEVRRNPKHGFVGDELR